MLFSNLRLKLVWDMGLLSWTRFMICQVFVSNCPDVNLCLEFRVESQVQSESSLLCKEGYCGLLRVKEHLTLASWLWVHLSWIVDIFEFPLCQIKLVGGAHRIVRVNTFYLFEISLLMIILKIWIYLLLLPALNWSCFTISNVVLQ